MNPEELSILFHDFLDEAARRVQEEYPGAVFYDGTYEPNVFNFHYNFFFGTAATGIRVVVNTFNDEVRYLISTIDPITHLQAIALPIDYSLLDAYNAARAEGYQPNIDTAPLALQNPVGRVLHDPAYWFRFGGSNRWITVTIESPHDPVITSEQPVQPHASVQSSP